MTQHEHNGDSLHPLVHFIPYSSQVSPSEGFRTCSPHPAKLQHYCSWFAVFLSFLSPRTSQHLQKSVDIPVLQASESTTRSRASGTATEQRQKMPQTFSIPLWGWTAFLWKPVTILDYFLMCPVCTQFKLFSFSSTSIIPALPWINDAQHLNVTWANALNNQPIHYWIFHSEKQTEVAFFIFVLKLHFTALFSQKLLIIVHFCNSTLLGTSTAALPFPSSGPISWVMEQTELHCAE